MITKATMWDSKIELTKGISCDWHEERGQMSMIVRTLDGEKDISHWSHDKLADALNDGYIKWGHADTIADWYRAHDILCEMPCIHKHQVIVGNIGTVVSTYFYLEAEIAYNHYATEEQQGRWKQEPVTWMYNGDIYKEFLPNRLVDKIARIVTEPALDDCDPRISICVNRPDGTKIVAFGVTVSLVNADIDPLIVIVADEVPAKEDQDA